MATINRKVATGLCGVVMGAGLALGTATAAQAMPAQITPQPVDDTPLVVQARDYPVGVQVTTSTGTGGFQHVVQPGEHFVLGTKSGYSSSIRFDFGSAVPGEVYEILPDRVMRFDAQGDAQHPSVTLRMS